MIPVMVDDEPFLRAYREVQINLQPLLASEAVVISDGQNFMSKTAGFNRNHAQQSSQRPTVITRQSSLRALCWCIRRLMCVGRS